MRAEQAGVWYLLVRAIQLIVAALLLADEAMPLRLRLCASTVSSSTHASD